MKPRQMTKINCFSVSIDGVKGVSIDVRTERQWELHDTLHTVNLVYWFEFVFFYNGDEWMGISTSGTLLAGVSSWKIGSDMVCQWKSCKIWSSRSVEKLLSDRRVIVKQEDLTWPSEQLPSVEKRNSQDIFINKSSADWVQTCRADKK